MQAPAADDADADEQTGDKRKAADKPASASKKPESKKAKTD